jgi:uncharacterized protein YjiS (DUF1127 family)
MSPSHETSAATLSAPQITPRRRRPEAPTLLSRLRETLNTWRQRRLARLDLLMLDDHTLRDIGLTRQQIATESSKHFWRA